MTRKQELYQDMLWWGLPWIWNVATWGWWRRWRGRLACKGAWCEAELIHNLPNSILEEEFTEHDICFLNHQARCYYEQCSSQLSPLYSAQMERLHELFSLVPPELRCKLEWPGPV